MYLYWWKGPPDAVNIILFIFWLILSVLYWLKIEKCSESIGKILVFSKYFFFLKIWPAETIASLLTRPKFLVFEIISSIKYRDLYPDIANNVKSDLDLLRYSNSSL